MNMMAKKLIWTWMIMVVLMACQQPGNKKAQVYRGERPKVDVHFTEVVPLKGVDGLPDTNVVVVGDGPEKQKQYEASLKKLDGLIAEMARKVDSYEDKPVYWVEIHSGGLASTLLELNGIRFSYAYTTRYNEFRLAWINPIIEKSGEQKLKIRVFDDAGLDDSDYSFLSVGYARDIRQRESQPQSLTDSIKVPAYAQDWLTVYWDTTITFQAQVPWDYSDRMARASDYRTLPNLEEQVLKKYEQLRQNFIDCDVAAHLAEDQSGLTRYFSSIYKTSYSEIESEISALYLDFAPNFEEKSVSPVEDYELALYKNGRIAHLRKQVDKWGVVRGTVFEPDADEEPYTYVYNYMLYLPEGATELQVY